MNSAAKKLEGMASLDDRRSVKVEGHRVGKIMRWDGNGPVVDFPGNPHGPLLARSSSAITAADASSADGQDVLLVFDDQQSNRPIVVALLTQPAEGHSRRAPQGLIAPQTDVDAFVDGTRIVIRGREQIVLECGQARITLNHDGRVLIRGVTVETRADDVNRIKGGTVRIN